MNTDQIETITPYFSTILSNFSEKDAIFLKKMVEQEDFINGWITADIRIEDSRGYGYEPFKDVMCWDDSSINNYSSQINTLLSFGLIQRWDKFTSVRDQELYAKIENSLLFQNVKSTLHLYTSSDKNYPYVNVLLKKKSVIVTDLGRDFIKAAVP